MAKKKIEKKTEKKVVMKAAPACSPEGACYCNGFMALIIIALTWWKPVEPWANWTITILAAIILISGNNCCCKK